MTKTNQPGSSTSKFLSKARIYGAMLMAANLLLIKTDSDLYAKWEVKDGQVMTWILGSIESNLVLNLRPSKTAAEMWTYLKKVYSQSNTARHFQLELDSATL